MSNIENRFAPGCALMLYKPELSGMVHEFLNQSVGNMPLHTTCCRHEPDFTEKRNIINVCSGCHKRFKNDYPKTTTESLWVILSKIADFPFPDYKGKKMTIMDACPTREEDEIHNAIRVLIKKMNINLVEPEKSRRKAICCGDSFYGVLPVSKVKEQMMSRNEQMPENDVIVYCVSCINSVFIGGKQPRHLLDLLFNEETIKKIIDPDAWHKKLDEYIIKH